MIELNHRDLSQVHKGDAFEHVTLQTIKAPQASMMHSRGFAGYYPAQFAIFLLRDVFNLSYFMREVMV
jgi:hypothetical protein